MKPLSLFLLITCLNVFPYYGTAQTVEVHVAHQIEFLSRTLNLEKESFVVASLQNGERMIQAKGKLHHEGPDATGNTLYEIGSITKAFTGIALADAVLQGKAKLNDPITKFLPEDLIKEESALRTITLKHLSTHTSGLPSLPDNFAISYNPQNPFAHYAESQLLYFLEHANESSIKPPGKHEYSNLAVGLLGYVLGRINNCSYSELIDALIFTPLGMDESFVHEDPDSIPEKFRANFAHGHSAGNVIPHWQFNIFSGAGAIVSSADDMLIFAEAHWKDSTPKRLKNAFKLATEKHSPRNGLGWFRTKDGAINHDGKTGGFRSLLEIHPERQTAFLTLQSGVDHLNEHSQTGDFTQFQGLWSSQIQANGKWLMVLNILPDGRACFYNANKGYAISSGKSLAIDKQLEIGFPKAHATLKASLEEGTLKGTLEYGRSTTFTLRKITELPERLAKVLKRRCPDDLTDLEGFWSATIPLSNLPIYLEIHPVGKFHQAFLFSPNQTPVPVPIDRLGWDGQKFSFEGHSINCSFSGTFQDPDTISGTWSQGAPLPLIFTHQDLRPKHR